MQELLQPKQGKQHRVYIFLATLIKLADKNVFCTVHELQGMVHKQPKSHASYGFVLCKIQSSGITES